MDINPVLTSIINKSTIEPLYFRGFSANIIPGTIGAPGFNLDENIESFHSIDWGVAIKIVNSSERDFAIENILSEWKGQDNFLCKSDNSCTNIHKLKYENDAGIIDNLLSNNTQLILLPFLLKGQSEIVIKVNFVLDVYKKRFPMRLNRFFFKRTEIKEPETYHMLYQKNLIKIKLNGKWRSIVLKPKEFLVAGDVLKIPDKK